MSSVQVAESTAARAALETKLAEVTAQLSAARADLDSMRSSAESATLALDAEKTAASEMTGKLQHLIREKASLKSEVAILEEQLLEYANAPKPGPADHLLNFFKSASNVAAEAAPGIVEEGIKTVKAVSTRVSTYIAPIIPALIKVTTIAGDVMYAAFAAAGPAAKKMAEAARIAFSSAGPFARAAAAKVTSVRDHLQSATHAKLSEIEAFAPHVHEGHARWFATFVLSVPFLYAASRAARTLVFPLFSFVLFGAARRRRGKRVPRRVQEDSVPLRTPTPDKKTAPFGVRTRTAGRTIRSPEGDVLRFA